MNVKDDGFGLAGAIAFVAWIFFTMIVMVIHSISSIPKTGGRSDYYKKLIALLLILAFIIFGGLALLGFIK